MKRPLVKICGITRLEDAARATRLGADRIGLVLAPSPRRIALDRVSAITSEVPDSVLPVGVFVNPTLDELDRAFDAGIRLAQLHGDETPEFCRSVPHPWMKAIRAQTPDDLRAIALFPAPEVLVDARVPGKYGGSGVSLPHSVVDAILRREEKIFIAGGIGPDNVASVLERGFAHGIDASSSLESEPGVKDPDLLSRFFRELARVLER